MARPKVAIVKTTPETVLDDIQSAMKMADVEAALPKDKTVILKDNISWHMPFLSANTTPWQLDGVIGSLNAAGYSDLVCVQNRTVVTDPRRGVRAMKLAPVLEKHDVPTKYNFDPRDMAWVHYEPKHKMRVLDKIFPEGIRIPDFFSGKSILHLPTVKCHIYTTMTGAMKNAFGGLLNSRRHQCHSVIHETLVDLLAIQQEIHTGIFTVMDGTICGNGAGPRTMTPVPKGYMLAGADSVAIDAVSASMMGFEPMDIGCIRMAHEAGLGRGRREEIDVVGEDIGEINFGFTWRQNMVSRVGRMIWFGPLHNLQRLLFQTQLVYLFVLGSFLYHDYIWWPMKGRRLMRGIAGTPWGKLFNEYPG
ncbi:MAG: DUF362 domain-containing protein [Planctomycetes bacterium]|nr:DUF362 domain-containing protein [Planctomycetota bacterium]